MGMNEAMKWPRFEVNVPGQGVQRCTALNPFDAITMPDFADADAGDATRGFLRMGDTFARVWDDAEKWLPGELAMTDATRAQSLIEAMHEGGWRPMQMAEFYKGVGRAMSAGMETEAAERADFSEAPEALAG